MPAKKYTTSPFSVVAKRRDLIFTLLTSGNTMEQVKCTIEAEGYTVNEKAFQNDVSIVRKQIAAIVPEQTKEDILKEGLAELERLKELAIKKGDIKTASSIVINSLKLQGIGTTTKVVEQTITNNTQINNHVLTTEQAQNIPLEARLQLLKAKGIEKIN